MTTYFEPIKGAGAERRDALGNMASYRKHPHRGSDWGFTTGSAGKPIYAKCARLSAYLCACVTYDYDA